MNTSPFASLKGASRLGVLLGILCAGCIMDPESKTRVITCTLSADTIPEYDDPMPPIPDTLVIKDGVCKEI